MGMKQMLRFKARQGLWREQQSLWPPQGMSYFIISISMLSGTGEGGGGGVSVCIPSVSERCPLLSPSHSTPGNVKAGPLP